MPKLEQVFGRLERAEEMVRADRIDRHGNLAIEKHQFRHHEDCRSALWIVVVIVTADRSDKA